jgi:hypothetical protein
VDAPGRPPAVFTISFPKVTPTADYPIEGCPGTATSHVNLRRHFMHRHPRDTLVIREEGSVPLPKCENCGMHVPRSALHSSRPTTAWCCQGHFLVGGAPLESVSVFQYLGRPLSSTDDDWPAIYKNLFKARKRWGWSLAC